MAEQETLTREAAIFNAHLDEWRKSHGGYFVLIKNDEVFVFFPTVDKAFAAGTDRFGLQPFFSSKSSRVTRSTLHCSAGAYSYPRSFRR